MQDKPRPWSKKPKQCRCPEVYAHGVCRPCYMRAYYAATKTERAAYWVKNKSTIVAKRAARKTVSRALHRTYMGLPTPTRPEADNCEVCGGFSFKKGKRAALCLDHDHVTGAFRGWLCDGCNTGIGRLGDNVAGLARAIAYLERNT
jgi:Recombination endonuclease VII